MAKPMDFYEPELPFPTRTAQTEVGPVEVYQIPDGQKEAVLKKLYPFNPVPSLEAVMEDIHAEKTFRVRDFMVAREGGMNVLASPFYIESGGTVIDWVPVDGGEEDEDSGSGDDGGKSAGTDDGN
jgi:hypothetical protein